MAEEAGVTWGNRAGESYDGDVSIRALLMRSSVLGNGRRTSMKFRASDPRITSNCAVCTYMFVCMRMPTQARTQCECWLVMVASCTHSDRNAANMEKLYGANHTEPSGPKISLATSMPVDSGSCVDTPLTAVTLSPTSTPAKSAGPP